MSTSSIKDTLVKRDQDGYVDLKIKESSNEDAPVRRGYANEQFLQLGNRILAIETLDFQTQINNLLQKSSDDDDALQQQIDQINETTDTLTNTTIPALQGGVAAAATKAELAAEKAELIADIEELAEEVEKVKDRQDENDAAHLLFATQASVNTLNGTLNGYISSSSAAINLKADQSEVDGLKTSKADQSEVTALSANVSGLSSQMTTVATKSSVTELEDQLTAQIGQKADQSEVNALQATITTMTAEIQALLERIQALEGEDQGGSEAPEGTDPPEGTD